MIINILTVSFEGSVDLDQLADKSCPDQSEQG